jgi:hypothetical protein
VQFKQRAITVALLSTVLISAFSGSATALPVNPATLSHRSSSVTSAKALIRTLYYGYQQASNISWAKQKSYILAHNYPGMYANAATCLNKYSSYSDIMPDLSSVSKEANWKLPSGVYLNKLSGKKPVGDTFVFQVTSNGAQAFNHATILKGKAYFYLWICDKSKPVAVNPTIQANRNYYSKALSLGSEESALLARYSAVSGVNYTSDLEMYNAVTDLIPDVQIFLDEINNLPTPTSELYQLNQIWYNGWATYLSAFSTLKYGLETQNGSQIAQANQYLTQGRTYMVQFSTGFRALKR